MTATASTMQALGSPLPKFDLPIVNVVAQQIKQVQSTQLAGQPVLVMFICNHCPYVVHIVDELSVLANRFVADGGAAIAISSNDIEGYPQDAPDKMIEFAERYKFEFPYCFDESQSVAKRFAAACTPDFYLYDAQHLLRYRGQFDASRPGNSKPVNGQDIATAIEAVGNKRLPNDSQIASVGCNIKWKPGQAPDYF